MAARVAGGPMAAAVVLVLVLEALRGAVVRDWTSAAAGESASMKLKSPEALSLCLEPNPEMFPAGAGAASLKSWETPAAAVMAVVEVVVAVAVEVQQLYL